MVMLMAMAAAATLSPGRAIGIIMASMLLWPEYLRVPLGVVQMSAPRAAAMVLVIRLLSGARGKSFRWNVVDILICVGWAWDLTANVIMGAGDVQLIMMAGRILDTVMMYLAARLALRDINDFKQLITPLVLTALFMGGMGAFEAIMSRSPYDPLYAFGGNPWFDKEAEYRYGFLRARASTGHAIYFGVVMALLAGILWSLRGMAKSKLVVWIGCGAACVGTLSSLSSGPQIALATLLICGAFFYIPWAIRPAQIALVSLCILVEFASNRHFFQLADYIAISSETAWYRGRLMEVAAERIGEYWFAGVGDNTPNHWGMLIDTRLHVDVVNHFIIVALYGGLFSLFCYSAVLIMAIRGCARAWRSPDRAVRTLAFGLSCTLISLMVASMSIGLFGPPLITTYLLIGSMVSVGVRYAVPKGRAQARGQRSMGGQRPRVSNQNQPGRSSAFGGAA